MSVVADVGTDVTTMTHSVIDPGAPIRVTEAAPTEWDALVARFPLRTVFHTLGWLEVIRESRGVRVVLARADQGDACVGVWPWLWLRKGPLRVVGSPLPGWATAYMGPLFAPRADRTRVMEAMARSRLFGRPAYSAVRVMDEDGELDLSPLGFTRQRRFETYLIDLTRTEEELWKNLKSECRSRIRKSQKQGVEIVVERDAAYLDDVWEISRDVFSRSEIQPPFDRAFLQRVHDHLFPHRLCVMTARHEGRRVGMLAIPHDDRVAMYWAGGSFTSAQSLAPNNQLHWEAFLECKRRGLSAYDFISSRGGPGRFKSTFGPEAREVATHWERSGSKLIGALKSRYERWLRERRRVAPAAAEPDASGEGPGA